MTNINELELYDLCRGCSDDVEEDNWEGVETGAESILQWFEHHKYNIVYLKVVALYSDERGMTGLHLLLFAGDRTLEVVQAYLKLAPETARIKDERGDLLLHFACEITSIKVVMALVEAYPKGLKEPNNVGDLPAHCAISGLDADDHHSLEVLNFLLESDPNSIYDKENKTKTSEVLHRRVNARVELTSRKRGDELIRSLIFQAVIRRYNLVVKLLLFAFPDIATMPDEHGVIPLHLVCSTASMETAKASFEMARALLDVAPESATTKMDWGISPLDLFMPLANTKNEHGMLLLHLQAAYSKFLTVTFLKFLIAAYPDSVDIQDDRGMLPFQYAFTNKSLSVDVLMFFVEMNLHRL